MSVEVGDENRSFKTVRHLSKHLEEIEVTNHIFIIFKHAIYVTKGVR